MIRYFIIDSLYNGYRIDQYAYAIGINQKALKAIKMKGDILVNGIHQSVRYIIKEGDVVTFIYPKEENNILPVNIPLKIVYEDDYLMVIDKQKNIACIPTRSHVDNTLANAISYYYKQNNIDSTVHLVNRLDKETAGLMIVAKYREIHDKMCKDISHITRLYHAHVLGEVQSGIINLPIYKDGHNMRRIIDERGKESITHYKCIHYKDGISKVQFLLETGRTHQIRVHMSSLSHPLVGDSLYGDGIGEFDLTSVMVAFVHPVTKQIKVIRKVCK